MPVEITLPLTKLEQAVADSRENERKCAFIVEDLKLQLKTAKATWEESVEEMKMAVDEMISDKKSPKQPGLFDDNADAGTGGGSPEPNPPTSPTGEPTATPQPATVTIVNTRPSWQVDLPPADVLSPIPMLPVASVAPASGETITGATHWRDIVAAEQLEASASILDALARHSVKTIGDLADALKLGHTFGLEDLQVSDLREIVEEASADDGEPAKAAHESPEDAMERMLDERQQGAVDDAAAFEKRMEQNHGPLPVEQEKPAKKTRGPRKKKSAAEDVKADAVPPVSEAEVKAVGVAPDPDTPEMVGEGQATEGQGTQGAFDFTDL